MHIRKLVSGRYQCIIRLQGVSTSKTFGSITEEERVLAGKRLTSFLSKLDK